MPRYPTREGSRHRFTIVDPTELESEREYCLTCEKFVEDSSRAPDSGS